MESQQFRPSPTPERRRAGWQEFRRSYPGIVATMSLALLVLLALDGWLIYKRTQYTRQIEGLRASMTAVERQKADVALAADADRLKLTMALLRRQASGEKALHLSVSTDSGKMYLERDGAVLRAIPLRIGAEKAVADGRDTVHLAAPRGTRTVERILDGSATWEVPRWVYNDRGIPASGERTIKGALGEGAILLNGGTVVYTLPSAGPLNDSSYVMPGSVRIGSADMKAILPNLKPGMSVYFF
jgi:hypothetical protein